MAAHAVKFMQPFAGWPRVTVDGKRVPVSASVVIVDEDMTSAGLAGTDRLHPTQLALSALASDETPNLTGLDRDRLLDLRQRVLAGLTGQPAGAMFRNAVEWMREALGGLSISPAREWAVLEWECKPRVKIAEGTTRAEALAAFGAAQAQGFTRLRPLLAE
ncbi:MAG: hypothetical protein M3452_08640, partial [Chloroflexota bacterium]|nr:hypothetical protein [Chloroflexota bacterium]